MIYRLFIISVAIVFPTSLFGRDTKKSSEYRAEKQWSAVWRAPTLTIVDTGIGTGETGFGFESIVSDKVSYFLDVQAGYAGNLGTFSGDGSSSRITVGFKRFFGNSFYLAPGIGIRHLNIGAVERRENEDYNSYDEQYYNAEIYRNVSTSMGAHLASGWQWQRKNFTVGLELTALFLPMINIYSNYSAENERYEERAKRNAKSFALLFDSSLPRFICGFAF
jgi:hypothetical protein